MTKQIEVITSVERRRRWSRAEKERIVAAAMEPGAVASEVARAARIERANCSDGASSSVSGRKFQRHSIRLRSRPSRELYLRPRRSGPV